MPSEHPAKPKAGVHRERQVQRLFSEIAPRYDLLNHVLSLNVDKGWRRKAVDLLGWEHAVDGRFLDACAGTFDLALELSGRPGFRGSVVASDFAQPMLREGVPKLTASSVIPVCGDSLQLPFPDDTFEGATVGFGVRNLADLEGGIRELRRVLRPGARLVVLEFTTPPNALVRWSYLFYFHRILPLVGRLVSRHPWAYSDLPKSVEQFPGPSALEAVFRDAGFRETDHRLLSLGIAALHWGVK